MSVCKMGQFMMKLRYKGNRICKKCQVVKKRDRRQTALEEKEGFRILTGKEKIIFGKAGGEDGEEKGSHCLKQNGFYCSQGQRQ